MTLQTTLTKNGLTVKGTKAEVSAYMERIAHDFGGMTVREFIERFRGD